MSTLAGTVQETRHLVGTTETITLRCTADSSGNVTHVIEGGAVRGMLYTLRTIPISGLSADWDAVLEDFDQTDWLRGKGANRSNSATNLVYLYDDDDPEVPIIVDGMLRLKLTGCGNAGAAIVEVVVENVPPTRPDIYGDAMLVPPPPPPPPPPGISGPAGPPGTGAGGFIPGSVQ